MLKTFLRYFFVFCSIQLFSQVPTDTVCAGDTSLHRYYISNPEPGATYTWNIPAGGVIKSIKKDTAFVMWGTTPGLFRLISGGKSAIGCQSEDSEYLIYLTEEGKPMADFDYLQTGNYIVKFTNKSLNGNSFFWQLGNDSISKESNPTASYKFDDKYSVELIVSNNCGSDTLRKEIDVKKIIGFDDLSQSKIIVGPNPVSDVLNIRTNFMITHSCSATLFNPAGQILSEKQFKNPVNQSFQIDISAFHDGIYLLRLDFEDDIFYKKIIKK